MLPSATATQFVLLVVALLGGSTFVYNYLFVISTHRFGNAIDGCLSDAEQGIAAQAPAHTVVAAYYSCWNGVDRTNSLLVLAGLAGMLAVAALLYLAHPWIYRRRHRLVRVDDALAPAVADRARALAAAAGLRRQPTLLMRPVLDIDAYSFGLRRKYVVVYQGLLLTAKTRPQVLDAYLRHEFGHLRNGDIALTQFALAAWRAFVLAAVVPFVVTLSTRPSSVTVHTVLAMALILIAIYVGTLLVLRLREHYADVRATVGDGPAGALGTLLSSATGRSRTWRDTVRWRKRRHPAEPARLDVVGDPVRLLQLRVLPMAVAGLSFGIGILSFPQLLTSLWSGADSRLVDLFSAVFRIGVGVLATGTVGLAGWRAAVACIVDRRPLPSAVAPAAALAVGIMIGTSINDRQSGTWWGLAVSDPVAGAVTAVVLFVLCLFFLQWSMACAALWLEVTSSAQWRRLALWGLPVGGVLAGLLFSDWFDALRPVAGALHLVVSLFNGQLALAAAAAVAWPLAAGLRLRRPPGPEVSLDQPLTATSWPLSPWPVRPAVPFAAGAAATLLFIVPMLMLRDRVAVDINGTIGQSLTGIGIVLATAAGLQCVAGLVAAALTGVRQATLGALHGLAAVIVAAPGMLAVLTVVLLAPTCADEPGSCLTRITSFGWHRSWLILLVSVAALVLTPLLWTVAWTARGLARLQGVAGWPQPPSPVHPRYAGTVRHETPRPRSTGGLVIGTVGAAILAFIVAVSVLPQSSPAPTGSQESGSTATIAEPPDYSLNSICTWWPQATLSASLSGNAIDSLGTADARAVGRVVAMSDDPLMRRIGEEVVSAAAAGDADRYLVAVSALGYRCAQLAASETTPPNQSSALSGHFPLGGPREAGGPSGLALGEGPPEKDQPSSRPRLMLQIPRP